MKTQVALPTVAQAHAQPQVAAAQPDQRPLGSAQRRQQAAIDASPRQVAQRQQLAGLLAHARQLPARQEAPQANLMANASGQPVNTTYPVVQRVVLDARRQLIPASHVSMILGLAVQDWLTGSVEEKRQQRQLWAGVIGKLTAQYAAKPKPAITIDQLIVELAANMPSGIHAPTYKVNPHSRQEDVHQGIAKKVPGAQAADDQKNDESAPERLDYDVPRGEEVRAPGRQPIRSDLRERPGKSELMWVLGKEGDVRVQKRENGARTPHPTLVGGVEPEVVSGGTVTTKEGRIEEIRDDSGHFQPRKPGAPHALKWMKKNPLPLSPNYRGFKTHGTEAGQLGYGATPKAHWQQAQQDIATIFDNQIKLVSNRLESNEKATNASNAHQNAVAVAARTSKVLEASLRSIEQTATLLDYWDQSGTKPNRKEWQKAETRLTELLTASQMPRNQTLEWAVRAMQITHAKLMLLKAANEK